MQECKEKWNKYSSELYTYEDYLKIRKFREQYDSEGGKKGTGFSFPEYLPGEAKGISDKIINSSRKKREMPIPPSDFYETMEEVLKAAEPARQGLKCARVEALRELLTMLVFNIESDGTSKYGDYNLMIYDVEARKADHKKNGNKIAFYTFRYGIEEVREKSEELLEELHDIQSSVTERRKKIEQ